MTTFYLDPEHGNDANAGDSFAAGHPWKTITGGPTAARIAPGDVIRIAKSPDPTSLGQTALWTNLSKNVVLQTGAVTANISICDHVAEAWTAGTGGTPSSDTTNYKMGTTNSKGGNRSVAIAVSGAGTNANLAYRDLGATGLDLSGYQQVSFWIRNTVAIVANNYALCLCSDQAGATPVNTIAIPAIPSTGQWICLTVDLAGALGNPIKSVALYSGSSAPSNGTVNFDNILACKASSSADSLTLQSLISKTSAAQGFGDGWYAIQSINGTTILIDQHVNARSGDGRGYGGTTATVTTYKRETIKTALAAAQGTVVAAIQDSGIGGSPIEFQGGYNTATDTQDGETFFDGLNGNGSGLNPNGKSYITLNYLNFYRYYNGFDTAAGAAYKFIISAMRCSHNTYAGIFASALWNSYFNAETNNNNSRGFFNNASPSGWRGSIISNNNNNLGLDCGAGGVNDVILESLIVCNNSSNGVQLNLNVKIKSLTTKDNASGAILTLRGNPCIYNATISEGTIVSSITDYTNPRVSFQKYSGVATDHRTYTDGGNILSETSVRHTASGLAWKLSPTSATRAASYPLNFKIAEIAVNANAQVTVSTWLRRTNTGITGSLVCRGGQIAGVDNDVKTDMTAAADTWEQVTIIFTPTAAGVVEIEAWAYGGTTYSVYVDDLSVSQA